MLEVAAIICTSGATFIYSGTSVLCTTNWCQENFDQLPSGQFNFAKICSYSKHLILLYHWQMTLKSYCG